MALMMTSREIRKQFLDYFASKGHTIVPSSSLIPAEDPSLLFTNAGMVQFKPLFLGKARKEYHRAATSQKCVRAGGKHNDLENVGYTARHHTFFEMLGNFSFGDYFKEEAISWAWELLTEIYGLPPEHLYVSVYLDDDEAYEIWENEMGVDPERIVRLGEEDNFWAMGDTGPCGPCSEILIDQGPEMGCSRPDCGPGCDCDRYLEIWNLVFTQFNRDAEGNLTPLPAPNIDTGMGLERLAAVLQGVKSNYDTDLFSELIETVERLSETSYGRSRQEDVAFRVISDHARAIAFLIGDGITPSNEGRGYVLRRIIRRAIRFGQTLELKEPFLVSVCEKVIGIMGRDYEELARAKDLIKGVVQNEERRFADTLRFSLQFLNDEIERLKAEGRDIISGDVAFKLYDTYGLSLDLIEEIAGDEGLNVDVESFQTAMAERRALSQQSWKGSGEEEIPEALHNLTAEGLHPRFVGYESLTASGSVSALVVEGEPVQVCDAGSHADVVLDQTPFYGEAGGQVGDKGWLVNDGNRFQVTDTLKYGHDLIVHRGYLESGRLSLGDRVEARVDAEKRKATARNHTATHLLHSVLRELLGEHVKQAGSLVSPERMRFDFSHFTRIDPETLLEVERRVNQHIRDNLPVQVHEMPKEEALKMGATAIFEEKYGETVRLVKTGDISKELCGGTHTAMTGDIGIFRIIAESAVGANLRRIEALTGEPALLHDQRQEQTLHHIAMLLKTSPDRVDQRTQQLLGELKEREREIDALRARLLARKSRDLATDAKQIGDVRIVAKEVEAGSPKELRESAEKIRDTLGSGIVVLAARSEGKAMLTCIVSEDLTDRFEAKRIIQDISGIVKGKGGGRADMAQGGGSKPESIPDALEALDGLVRREQSI